MRREVSGNLVVVQITKESVYGGWDARNVKTGRDMRIKTAERLRRVIRSPVAIDKTKDGAVCSRCGKTVTERECSSGQTDCCKADVIAKEK